MHTPFNWRTWAGALAAVGALAACQEASDGTLVGSSEADSIGADMAMGKDGAAATGDADGGALSVDSAAEIAAASDTASDVPPDSAPTDTAPVDTAPADSAPTDSAPTDSSPADTAPADTAKPDAADTDQDPCAAKQAQFDAVKVKALACSTPFECYKPAPADGKCQTCQRHFNGNSADSQNLIDMAAMLKGNGCGATCGTGCYNMATHVGVCGGGQCATKELTCKELDAAAAAALAEGAKCSSDADCTFKVSNTLACGCPTFVNVKTMGPAKPLFNYMKMLVLAYKAKLCTAETSCACPDPNTAKCVAGMCIAQ